MILLNNLGALSYIFTGNTGNTGNTGSILLNLLGTGFKNWEQTGNTGNRLGTDYRYKFLLLFPLCTHFFLRLNSLVCTQFWKMG